MKKQILTMFTGLFIGAIITGGASAYAAGILAERSNHRIFVDGQEVQMEAYGIAGHNYVKLRDIGKAVGFNVFWDADSGCVQIETGAPYTGEAPSAEAVPPAAAPSDVDAAKQDIVARTNALRAERGIAALAADDQLMRAAQVRADEMAAQVPILIPDRTAGSTTPLRTADRSGKIFTRSRCFILSSKNPRLRRRSYIHGQNPQGTWKT